MSADNLKYWNGMPVLGYYMPETDPVEVAVFTYFFGGYNKLAAVTKKQTGTVWPYEEKFAEIEEIYQRDAWIMLLEESLSNGVPVGEVSLDVLNEHRGALVIAYYLGCLAGQLVVLEDHRELRAQGQPVITTPRDEYYLFEQIVIALDYKIKGSINPLMPNCFEIEDLEELFALTEKLKVIQREHNGSEKLPERIPQVDRDLYVSTFARVVKFASIETGLSGGSVPIPDFAVRMHSAATSVTYMLENQDRFNDRSEISEVLYSLNKKYLEDIDKSEIGPLYDLLSSFLSHYEEAVYLTTAEDQIADFGDVPDFAEDVKEILEAEYPDLKDQRRKYNTMNYWLAHFNTPDIKASQLRTM